MLKRIKKVLRNFSTAPDKFSEEDESESVKFAVAILLVEVMYADHEMDERETSMVMQILQKQFELDEASARSLFSKADEQVKDVVPLHQYTSYLGAKLSYEDKQTFMTNMWRVVYADDQVDKYEEHLVRRVADLIHVRHKDFIKAKHRAQQDPVC